MKNAEGNTMTQKSKSMLLKCSICNANLGPQNKSGLCSICSRKEYHKTHREHYNKLSKQYYQNHKEERLEYSRNYQERRRVLSKERYNNDNIYHFIINTRHLVGDSFKRACKGIYRKSCKTEKILGCNMKDFMIYIEQLFLPGMSFDNYGE